MEIIRVEARASQRGNREYFTGTVWLDEISGPDTSVRLRAFRVTFEPGARTAWHTHPCGQVLHILHGVGRVQRGGGPVQTVRPGDTVKIEPNERHWHGAAPGHAMIHLALQESDAAGSHSTWQEKVTDDDYRQGEAHVA